MHAKITKQAKHFQNVTSSKGIFFYVCQFPAHNRFLIIIPAAMLKNTNVIRTRPSVILPSSLTFSPLQVTFMLNKSQQRLNEPISSDSFLCCTPYSTNDPYYIFIKTSQEGEFGYFHYRIKAEL